MRTDPPTEDDFQSQRAEYPEREFPESLDCQSRGVSVYRRRKDAVAVRSSTPNLQNRKVCEVRLGSGAGTILRTGRFSHHTWWPFAEYDILVACTVDSP